MNNLNSKKNRNIKLVLIISLMLFLVPSLVYGMYRLSIGNKVSTAKVLIKVVEGPTPKPHNYEYIDWGQKKDKSVKFQNDSNVDVLLRVSYAQMWEFNDGIQSVVLSSKLEGKDLTTIIWEDTFIQDWKDGGDGWYYYKKILKSGEATPNIVSGVLFNRVMDSVYYYDHTNYKLRFKAEAVQASNQYEVSRNASNVLFKKSFQVAGGEASWKADKYSNTLEW